MKVLKKIAAALAAVVVAVSGMCVTASADSNIANECRSGVVYIRNGQAWVDDYSFYRNGYGSGFAVGKKGQPVEYIVTNAHVISQVATSTYSTDITVYFSEKANKFMSPEVVYFDLTKDIAILKLPEPTTERSPLMIADVDSVDAGDVDYVLGYPDYGESNVTKHDETDIMIVSGVVSKRDKIDWAERNDGSNVEVFLTDAKSSNGNSGGPAINEKGAVIGIYSGAKMGGTAAHQTDICVAISSGELVRALNSVGADYEMYSEGGSSMMLIIICSAAGVVVAAAVIVIVVVMKKKKGAAKPAGAVQNAAAVPVQNNTGSVAIIGANGNFKGSTFVVNGVLVIGRNPQKCNVCYPVDTKGVSGVHCQVKRSGMGVELVDCGSTNGTFLGSGQKLQPNVPVVLNNGDYFYLASTEQMFQIKNI